MTVLRASALLFAVALLLALPCHGDAIDDLLETAMHRDQVPGMALLMTRPGKVQRRSGYGLADVEHRVPVQHDTLFQTGSLGKQFTAAAMLLLQERGRVSLQDPISRYLPGVPPAWAPITVRQLLDHTSGIHDSEEDGGEVFELRREYTDDELVKVLQSYPLNFPPGSRWKYSNSGYILAGILITRITGRFYAEFLAQEMFAPLHMRTARIISNTDIIPNRALGYVRSGRGIRNQDFVSAALNSTADGSLYLSLDDWSAWIAAMDRGALLSGASWAQLSARTATGDGQLTEHGFCWDHLRLRGHEVIEFDGSWQGFRAAIERDPASGLTVVLLANLAEAEPVPLAREVLERSAGWR
ncbi:MAG: beta-lactamase family protein [Proteobacteria bacterium]|nr:beta-lactamase family protein [Pseudomonadota bacterium]